MRHFLGVALVCLLVGSAWAKEFAVSDAKGIRSAMQSAQAGDTINIQPGEYDMGDATRGQSRC